MNWNRKIPGTRGLSLVELLVSIGLIAVLVSLGFPFIQRIRNQAHAAKCSTKLRQIGIGLHLYLCEHNRTFPNLAAGRESLDDTDTPVLETLLVNGEYLSDKTLFNCPSDHEFYRATGSSYFWNTLVNGQRMGNMNLMGIIKQEAGIPIVSDKENFHKHIGGEVNILYADGHTYKDLQFTVELDSN